MHPQTLRQYDRLGLVSPTRTAGKSRRYSMRDVVQLREIAALSAEGLNLEGIKRILDLENQVAELDRARSRTRARPRRRTARRPGRRVFAAGTAGEVVSLRAGARAQKPNQVVVWRPIVARHRGPMSTFDFATLRRFPDVEAPEPLRASDASDRLILDEAAVALAGSGTARSSSSATDYGALTLGAPRCTGSRAIRVHQDSLVSERALAANAHEFDGVRTNLPLGRELLERRVASFCCNCRARSMSSTRSRRRSRRSRIPR